MKDWGTSEIEVLGKLRVAGQTTSSLPLENTTVAAQVIGPLAVVTVIQRFGNPINHNVELEYLFPLPHQAALVDFDLKIGARLIKGDLRELEAARENYEKAKEEGRRAGLLDQRRPNLFAVRIANILPGENIVATLRYQESLKLEDGRFEFVFSMAVTPRYNSAHHPGESQGTQIPVAGKYEPVGPVDITLSLDAGVPIEDPVSLTHPIEVTRFDERRCLVKLAGEHIPDRDFILRYSAGCPQVAAGAWTSSDQAGESFLAVLVPPALSEISSIQSREFVFVLDRSGSMSGGPVAQARNALRACLRGLNLNDTFRILLFDDQLEWYKNESTRVQQNEIDQADRFLANVEGRGGTEIVEALEAVLMLPADQERIRFVVFLTDGAVSAENRALDKVRRKIGNARLFTFGIGPSVNRALLNQLSAAGRGASDFLQLDEDIEGAIIRFQDRVSFPALTDLKLDVSGAEAWDVYPARLPDLYFGQTLEICGRLVRKGNSVELVVCGKAGDHPVILKAALPKPVSPEPMITRVWARGRVNDLLDQIELEPERSSQLRAQIISLALEHRLVTPYTAFVAMDQEKAAKDSKPTLLQVSQPLPAGLEYDGFGLSTPVPTLTAFLMAPPLEAGVLDDGSTLMYDVGTQHVGFPARQKGQLRSAFTGMVPMLASPAPINEQHIREQTGAEMDIPLEKGSAALRSLVRTQSLNGSWDDDIEQTSAALLAFVRMRFTTNTGSFRQQVRRAFEWLSTCRGTGFAEFARVFALKSLAVATGLNHHQSAAEQAILTLPAPTLMLEKAALDLIMGGIPPAVKPPVDTMDELRLAGLVGANLTVSRRLLQKHPRNLVLAWAACLK